MVHNIQVEVVEYIRDIVKIDYRLRSKDYSFNSYNLCILTFTPKYVFLFIYILISLN